MEDKLSDVTPVHGMSMETTGRTTEEQTATLPATSTPGATRAKANDSPANVSSESFKSMSGSDINLTLNSCRDVPNKLFHDISNLRTMFTHTMSTLLDDSNFNPEQCLTEIKINPAKTVNKPILCTLFADVLNAIRPICQQKYSMLQRRRPLNTIVSQVT